MRAVTIVGRTTDAAPISTATIQRGGRCVGINHQVAVTSGNGPEVSILRLKSLLPTVVASATADVETDWLSVVVNEFNGSPGTFSRVDFQIDDNQRLYITRLHVGGAGSSSTQHFITLWFEDATRPRDLPEEDLPQPRGRRAGRGRSFNLGDLRAVPEGDSGVSRLHRPKKPSH